MNQNYSHQTGQAKYFDRVIPPISTPDIFQSGLINSSAPAFYCKSPDANKILKNLAPDVLQSILSQLEKVYLEKNQALCTAGDDISFVYFPETAVITEFQMLPDGKTKGVALIGSEGLHGISALLGANTSNNWAQALVGGTALRIRTDVIRQYFEQCRFVQKNILEYLNSYLRQISQKVICSTHHSVGERLCTWVLMVADCCQNRQLSLTQEQIAFFLGVQRPSVTIITQQLRKKGMINYKRGNFVILDREQLEATACVCYEAAKSYQNKKYL